MNGKLILYTINGAKTTIHTDNIELALKEIANNKWVSFQSENGETIINTDNLISVESVIE